VEAVIHGLAVVDLDGDGQADIVAARMHQGAPPQELAVYLNGERGQNGRRSSSQSAARTTSWRDFTGDGRPTSSEPIMAGRINRWSFG
jgi:hypothetical protein